MSCKYHKSYKFYLTLALVIAAAAVFFAAGSVLAVNTKLPIPGPGAASVSVKKLDAYATVRYLFTFGLGAIGLVTFGSIIYAATKYMAAAGDPGAIKDAKDRIYSALWGIGLALISVLLLATINPDLVRFLGKGKLMVPKIPLPEVKCGDNDGKTIGPCATTGDYCFLNKEGTKYQCMTPEDYQKSIRPCPEGQQLKSFTDLDSDKTWEVCLP